jgi:[pyruvate, water dikinase]-phosphate phosphotransferase / [pyruvate, water dikinase] kinase
LKNCFFNYIKKYKLCYFLFIEINKLYNLKDIYRIFVVSGGTGRTAKQVVRAALTQFPERQPEIITFSDIREIHKVGEIINQAQENNALIVYSFVENELRDFIYYECESRNMMSIDILGNVIDKLSNLFVQDPLQAPGLFNKLNQEYFQRIDAVHFAFKHDDGARIEELDKSEIILLGVSRTFKTPLSIYLAYKGYFVTNIPIIEGMELPENLNKVDPSKVFCLTTDANKLSELRKSRNIRLGGQVTEYSDYTSVKKELLYALRFFISHPQWKIIEVTDKSIEEIASEILDSLKK